MKEIPLTNSTLVAFVDDEDYERLVENRWQLMIDPKRRIAGAKRTRNVRGKYSIVLMHRVIMNAPDGIQVDHINRNPLDNRKNNLRFATHLENCRNRTGVPGSSSQFKGVSWHKTKQRWTANIRVDTKLRHLGSFLREEDAAIAYNNVARIEFGEFAYINPVAPIQTVMPATESPSQTTAD